MKGVSAAQKMRPFSIIKWIIVNFFPGTITLLSPLYQQNFKGCAIYLTHFPSKSFVHCIQVAGISEVVYCTLSGKDADKWEQNDLVTAKKFLDYSLISYM